MISCKSSLSWALCLFFSPVAWLWFVHCKEWRSSSNWSTVCWVLRKYGKCLESMTFVSFMTLVSSHWRSWYVICVAFFFLAGERQYWCRHSLLLDCNWGLSSFMIDVERVAKRKCIKSNTEKFPLVRDYIWTSVQSVT